MTAWGKTGRVTLVAYDIGEPEVDREILIDGMRVARAIRQRRSTRWFVSWPGREISPALPSRDAAVLWVLRRADPALWRQERGAWLVRKRKPGEGIADVWFFRGPREFNPAFPWLIVDPNGVSRDAAVDIQSANRYAAKYAAHPEAVSA